MLKKACSKFNFFTKFPWFFLDFHLTISIILRERESLRPFSTRVKSAAQSIGLSTELHFDCARESSNNSLVSAALFSRIVENGLYENKIIFLNNILKIHGWVPIWFYNFQFILSSIIPYYVVAFAKLPGKIESHTYLNYSFSQHESSNHAIIFSKIIVFRTKLRYVNSLKQFCWWKFVNC